LKRLQFITAIPLSVERGSGCFVGIRTLMEGLRALGNQVELVTPKLHLPVFTATRILFNELLRFRQFQADATVGFDLDGYRVAGSRGIPHIANIKGVLGDAVRFESGFTRASLALQARLEKLHARRADGVITISRYCAERIEELYGVRDAAVVPEPIDLNAWRNLFTRNPAPPSQGRFTVLCVCRFYPRKRVDLLLRAAALLTSQIPDLAVRIVGGGWEQMRLRTLWQELRLESVVHWVGDASPDELAREYNTADVFCLPSVQEGFGIVFLEAMAAGKPIVATGAAAVPEVVTQGLLVEPDNVEALADAIGQLYSDSDLRVRLGDAGRREVEKYEMTRVARQFLGALR
jgi:glycosyltransferase involved in cell wall biosynthesis